MKTSHTAAPRARGRPELPHEAQLALSALIVVRLRIARSRNMVVAFDKTAEGLAKDMRRDPGKRGGRTPVERRSFREAVLHSRACTPMFAPAWMVESLRLAQAVRAWLPNSEVEAAVLCEIRYPLMGERAEVTAVRNGIEGFERGKDDEAHFLGCHRHSDLARVRNRGAPLNMPLLASPAQDRVSCASPAATVPDQARLRRFPVGEGVRVVAHAVHVAVSRLHGIVVEGVRVVARAVAVGVHRLRGIHGEEVRVVAHAVAVAVPHAPRADLDTTVGNHAYRGTGITTYLQHPDVKLEEAQIMATHADPKAIRLQDKRNSPSQSTTLSEFDFRTRPLFSLSINSGIKPA